MKDSLGPTSIKHIYIYVNLISGNFPSNTSTVKYTDAFNYSPTWTQLYKLDYTNSALAKQ